MDVIKRSYNISFMLVLYDLVVFGVVAVLMLGLYRGAGVLSSEGLLLHGFWAAAFIFGSRLWWNIYKQIWRYGGIQCYIRLITADAMSMLIYLVADKLFFVQPISVAKLVAVCCVNTLCVLTMRMAYRYAYKRGSGDDGIGHLCRWLLKVFAGGKVTTEPTPESGKSKIAIIGAGTVGSSLAEELRDNPVSMYVPLFFLDTKKNKIGRLIHGLEVLEEGSGKAIEELRAADINLVVLAIPNIDTDRRKKIYEYYQSHGFQIKVYDYPMVHVASGKRVLRSFEAEELLFRKAMDVLDKETCGYYRDKVVLITGGGGSIGSELCRQLAKMGPKKLIILDIYENGAYDV